MARDTKTTIGQAELVQLPGINAQDIPARIDTGAHTSALWVSSAKVRSGVLTVIFFGEGSPYHTGKRYKFSSFEQVKVASSNGDREERFVIRTTVRIGGRKIRARFTLANRSKQVYPVLIGRNVLRGKFVVDVSAGSPIARGDNHSGEPKGGRS